MLNKVFCFLFLIFFSTVLIGQNEFPEEVAYSNDDVVILTWNPTSLLSAKATVGLEYILSKRTSAKISGGLVLLPSIYRNAMGSTFAEFPEVGIDENNVDMLRFKGYDLTGEFRFYLSSKKQAPEGLYLAPFVRYCNYTWTTPDSHPILLTTSNTITEARWALTYHAPTFGINVGGQSIRDNGFVFGWHIGLGVGPGRLKVKATKAVDYIGDDYGELMQEMGDMLWGNRPEFINSGGGSANPNYAQSGVDFTTFAIPVGISLGYQF